MCIFTKKPKGEEEEITFKFKEDEVVEKTDRPKYRICKNRETKMYRVEVLTYMNVYEMSMYRPHTEELLLPNGPPITKDFVRKHRRACEKEIERLVKIDDDNVWEPVESIKEERDEDDEQLTDLLDKIGDLRDRLERTEKLYSAMVYMKTW